ncbi:hypothetical protein POX_f08001 [Penicillium oxalicum]|uniref:Nab2-like CCCH zinc finger domain-containing protein n=1 Tax=Penicillium oxalicum (strain 114-2 / CGMCC 5302) TaxID=933388 RepID=S8B383_PENO1|nr:hypothetical protein POX_f08001 [Penicillium oxalicum]EPS28927.1 hypothetical protein PDE_03873 [Penicillium oxalicum 114-2]KAI2787628.1 hypothetical protein POX_f08001 [Penicillium oxalicum]
MLPTITQDSQLATAVANVVRPKLVEMGWSTDDGQESALIEYIVLMLVNGKTQEQLATELSNDFLGLEEGDTQALEFSRWLFGQVEILDQELNGGGVSGVENSAAPQSVLSPNAPDFTPQGNGMDAEMGDAGDSVPTGPKAMRNGRGGGQRRMLNQINRTLDRQGDGALHRVRGHQGNGRVGGYNQNNMKNNRGGRGGRNMGGMMGQNMGGPAMQMSPENQMQIMAMLEEQARMMSQLMPGFVPPAINPNFQNGGQQGRSLFDRVEPQGRRGGRFQGRGGHQHKGRGGENGDIEMDTAMDGEQDESNPNSVCRFNLRCTRKDCPFAHQSPVAPEGTAVDVSDICSFGAACKNRKCTGRHPSPAVKSAHQAEEICRFFPNCTNPHCHFKHPDMPLCRNGADCKTEGCKFTHLQVPCKFNPCMNPRCTYKHVEGQRGNFGDKVWTPGSTSERKFVADEGAPEELIKPETEETSQNQELTA